MAVDEVDVEEGEDEEVIPTLTATYDEEWLDAALPKIGNRTSREMLQDEGTRSPAVALLKDLERTAELAGVDRSEIAPAWEKLGLVRGVGS